MTGYRGGYRFVLVGDDEFLIPPPDRIRLQHPMAARGMRSVPPVAAAAAADEPASLRLAGP